jgi:hypothetical protein
LTSWISAAARFCIVYGFSNAALHSWHTPSTWGFLAAGVVLLVLFGGRQARAPQPLLPPRVVTDRNRGGAYLTMLIASAGMFGIFLFVTYYLQQTLGFSPVVTGLAFLPMVAGIMTASITSNIVLMPRLRPRPLAPTGMILAAGGLALLTRIGVHSSYAGGVLPSLLMMGLGLVFAPSSTPGPSACRRRTRASPPPPSAPGSSSAGRSAPRCSTRSSRVPSPAISATAVPARRWPGRR